MTSMPSHAAALQALSRLDSWGSQQQMNGRDRANGAIMSPQLLLSEAHGGNATLCDRVCALELACSFMRESLHLLPHLHSGIRQIVESHVKILHEVENLKTKFEHEQKGELDNRECLNKTLQDLEDLKKKFERGQKDESKDRECPSSHGRADATLMDLNSSSFNGNLQLGEDALFQELQFSHKMLDSKVEHLVQRVDALAERHQINFEERQQPTLGEHQQSNFTKLSEESSRGDVDSPTAQRRQEREFTTLSTGEKVTEDQVTEGARTLHEQITRLETRRVSLVNKYQNKDTVMIAHEMRSVVEDRVKIKKFSALEESVWEIVLVVFMHGVRRSESLQAVLLLAINVIMQTLICAVLVVYFDGGDHPGAREWRTDVGHWEQFATSYGRPMIDRLCKETMLEYAGSQQIMYSKVKNYLSNFLGVPIGVVVSTWCLFVWFLFVWQEIQQAFDRLTCLRDMPVGEHTGIYPHEDGGFVMCTMSKNRHCFACAVSLARIGVAATVGYAGSNWLANTEDVESLLLNSVALVFVTDIDDLLFRVACPLTIRAFIDGIEPMPCRVIGGLRMPVRGIVSVIASATFLFTFGITLLRTQLRAIEKSQEKFCDGNTNFVVGVNSYTDLVYSYDPTHAHQGSSGSLLQTVSKQLIDNVNVDNHVAVHSWEQFQEYVKMPLASSVVIFGKCENFGAQDGHMLASLQQAVRNTSITSCQDLHVDQCTLQNAIVRLACPLKCHCDAPFEGTYWMDGCPAVRCTATSGYQRQLKLLRHEDIRPQVLAMTDEWKSYWKQYVMYLKDHPSFNIINQDPTAVRAKFMDLGCLAIGYWSNAPNASGDLVREFFCVESPYRRPLRPFCPESCECASKRTSQDHFCPLPAQKAALIACPGLTVSGTHAVPQTSCNQTLPQGSNMTGFYTCTPVRYNQKHAYVRVDSTGTVWTIRWEMTSNLDYGAFFLGQKVGLNSTDKWALTSRTPQTQTGSLIQTAQFYPEERFFAEDHGSGNLHPPDSGWEPRTEANTDFDCASGTFTTSDVTKYSAEAGNTNSCPNPKVSIYDYGDCSTASSAFGLSFKLQTGWFDDYPKGCYIWNSTGSMFVYFNNGTVQGNSDPSSYPVCSQPPQVSGGPG